MKRISSFILFVFCILSAMAQYESAGVPLKFSVDNTMLRRSVSNFYIDINADTTNIPLNLDSGKVISGVTCPVDISMNEGLVFTQGDLKVWRVGLTSENARGISLFFDRFLLPEGGKLFIYNPEQTKILGAFTSENNNNENQLLIRPIASDSVIVEYQEPLNAEFNADLHISVATHELRGANPFLSSNLCSPHVNWVEGADLLKRSVCMLFMVGASYSYYGTGSLISNENNKPYVYTAGHNIQSADLAKKTIFYFNYEVPAQDSIYQGSLELTISGSTLLSRADDIDFALVELNKMPPITYRPYMAGWSRNTPEAPLMSIQHPNGDVKKLSIVNNAPSVGKFTIADDSWYISRWSKGVTEKGSSGSPLFDANGYIVGQLTGGSSYCDTPVSDYFCRLDVSWNYFSDNDKQLACHLNPSGTDVMFMQGYDPYLGTNVRRISNLSAEDEISLLRVDKTPLIGHNTYGYTKYAERYELEAGAYVYGAYLVPIKGKYNSEVPINLKVYSGTDKPETLLSTVLVNPKEVICYRSGNWGEKDVVSFSKREIYVGLPEPVFVSDNLFISLEINYNGMAAVDTLAMAGAKDKDICTAYFYDNQWKPFTQHPSGSINASIWIDPVISDKNVVSVEECTKEIHNYIVFPNPTSGLINIIPANGGNYRLYNVAGSLISLGEIPESLILPEKGFYILELSTLGGKKETHKLICR